MKERDKKIIEEVFNESIETIIEKYSYRYNSKNKDLYLLCLEYSLILYKHIEENKFKNIQFFRDLIIKGILEHFRNISTCLYKDSKKYIILNKNYYK